MRAVIVKAGEAERQKALSVEDVQADMNTLYSVLGSTAVETVEVTIDQKTYSLIHANGQNSLSAISSKNPDYRLFGNLVIFGLTEDKTLRSLSTEETIRISMHVALNIAKDGEAAHILIMD